MKRWLAFNAPIVLVAWWLADRWHLPPKDHLLLILFAVGANALGYAEGDR